MPSDLDRLQLQLIAGACAADSYLLAGMFLSCLPADVRATLGTRLDSSSLFQLNAWKLL